MSHAFILISVKSPILAWDLLQNMTLSSCHVFRYSSFQLKLLRRARVKACTRCVPLTSSFPAVHHYQTTW